VISISPESDIDKFKMINKKNLPPLQVEEPPFEPIRHSEMVSQEAKVSQITPKSNSIKVE
jgi:hypothetical protein